MDENRPLTLEEMRYLATHDSLPEDTKPQENDNDRILKEMLAQAEKAKLEAERKAYEEERKKPPVPVSEVLRNNGTRASNRERTGKRDMTVSSNARPIGTEPGTLDTIRHFDGDLIQVCSRCARSYIFIEDSTDPKKASTYTRALAEDVSHTAWAMLIIHHKDDVEGQKLIKRIVVWRNGRQLLGDQKDVRWDDWRKYMEKLAGEHAAVCRPRKRFE